MSHERVGSVIMEKDSGDSYLATGDVNGVVKIWDIVDYGLNFDSKSITSIADRNGKFSK